MRGTHLCGHQNILKRLAHAGAFNLELLMRQLVGHGTPRGLWGSLRAVLRLLMTRAGLRDTCWSVLPCREPLERHVLVYSPGRNEIPLLA